jgi:hypothetical protein
LKTIRADWVEKIDLEKALQKLEKKSGFFSKNSQEHLEDYQIIFRPFKRVTLNVVGINNDEIITKESFIDAELAPLIEDGNHRILLWRPKYVGCETVTDASIEEAILNNTAIQSVIDDMIEQRWQAQDHDEEMRPKLRRLQADPLIPFAIILPRTPGGLRKENVIVEDRTPMHAYVLATSLITNTASRDIIASSDIGNTIAIETIIATYRNEEGLTRLLALETAGTDSLKEAIKSGRALTRLCELYGDCREILSKTPK